MKRFYFLIIALVFALCACTPGGDVEEVTGPGSEQTTPNNPGNDGGENGDKPGDGNGGESGEEGGKNEGEGGENGEGGNEGGSEGENEPLFEIVEPERTVGYDSDILEFTIVYTDKNALSVIIDEEKYEWLWFSGVREDKIYFRVSPNHGETSRTGEAVVKDDVTGKSVTVRITQMCGPVQDEPVREMILTPQSFDEIEACGGVFNLTLEGYFDTDGLYEKYDYGESSDSEWCFIQSEEGFPTISDTGLYTDKMLVRVLPNLSTEARSVTVTFRYPKYDLTATIVISQKGYVSDGEQTQLRYTTSDGKIITDGVFDAPIISNVYENGEGVITFDGSLRQVLAFVSSKLVSVTFPESVEELGDSAMCGCDKLRKVVIGSNVKKMGYAIFEWSGDVVNGLEVEVNSPIGNNSFALSNITKVVCGSGVTSIGDEAFLYSRDLSVVKFAEGLKTIGKKAFSSTGLLTIKLPNSLETIGDDAFEYCRTLVMVVIGNKDGVCRFKEFGSLVFYDSVVATLVCYATNPPKYGDYMLYKDSDDGMSLEPTTCVIFVPQNSWSKYRSAAGWKAHSMYISSITQTLEDGLKDIE